MNVGGMSQGQIISVASAAALLLSLFLAWGGSSVDIPDVEVPAGVPVPPGVEDIEDSATLSGWESQNTLDIYLAIVAGLVLAGAFLRMRGNAEGLFFAPAAATFLLGAIGTILTLYVLIDIPEGAERKIGLFLAVAAIAGVTVGSYLQVQEEVAEEY